MSKKNRFYTITVTDNDGDTLFLGEIDKKDFHMKLTNDLESMPDILGKFRPIELISKGTFIDISGYVPNKDYLAEINKPLKGDK